jgi:hypothetical protein
MTDTLARAKDQTPPKVGKPVRREWTTEEATVEIVSLRADMTTEEIDRVQSHLERIRDSFPTERKYLADELVWPWQPCPTNGHVGYRFRFKRSNGSMSGIRCHQCATNRKASKPRKRKLPTDRASRAIPRARRGTPSAKALGQILFGINAPKKLLARAESDTKD